MILRLDRFRDGPWWVAWYNPDPSDAITPNHIHQADAPLPGPDPALRVVVPDLLGEGDSVGIEFRPRWPQTA